MTCVLCLTIGVVATCAAFWLAHRIADAHDRQERIGRNEWEG